MGWGRLTMRQTTCSTARFLAQYFKRLRELVIEFIGFVSHRPGLSKIRFDHLVFSDQELEYIGRHMAWNKVKTQ